VRALVLLVVLVPQLAHAVCDPALKATVTPRIKLQRPSTKMCDWDIPIQQSFDLLDAGVGMLTLSQTWTATQNFQAFQTTRGSASPVSLLQSDASGIGAWTPNPHVSSLTVDQFITVNGQPIASSDVGQTRRLGGVYFDLGAATLTPVAWPMRLEPYPATITRVECESYSGTSFTIKLCASEETSVTTCTTDILAGPTLVCDTTGASTTSFTAAATVAARQKVTVIVTAVSGAVTKGEVYIQGTVLAPATTTTAPVVTTTSSTTTPPPTTTTTSLPPAPNWTSSFLGVWHMDETTGTRVNAQGTTTRNLTESAPPIYGNTSTFIEGTASVNSSVSAYLYSSDTTLVGLTSPFTCLFWARANTNTTGRIVENWSPGGTYGTGWWLERNAGGYFDIGWGSGTTAGGGMSTGVVPPNTWAHMALTAAVGAAGCTSYLNGAYANDSGGSCTVTAPPGTQTFKAGGQITGFDGQIDELACASRVLTAQQVCRICSCGINGSGCSCNTGTPANYTSTGRNTTYCGSCTLPVCNAAAP